jgi:hypothetical protein
VVANPDKRPIACIQKINFAFTAICNPPTMKVINLPIPVIS